MNKYNELFLNIKHISFDLDNTLYDETLYFESAIKDISKFLEKNEKIDEKETTVFLWDTLTTRGYHYHHLFDDLLSHFKLDSDYFPKIMTIFKSTKSQLQFFEGVPKMLKKLKKNYELSLITSGQKENQQNKIKLLGAEKYFDLIIFSSSLKEDKPSSIPYEYLSKLTKQNFKNMIYVGDNPMTDFKGANELGITTIGVENNFLKNNLIKNEYNPKIRIKNVIELQKYLK